MIQKYLVPALGVALLLSLGTNGVLMKRLSARHDTIVSLTDTNTALAKSLNDCNNLAKEKAATEARNYEGLEAGWQRRCAAAYDAGLSDKADAAIINSGRYLPKPRTGGKPAGTGSAGN
jgi:hypothetical protein